MAKKAYIPEAYDPNQHGSYQSYIINFLSNDSSVASCINPEHNSQEIDLSKMMDECPSPLPFSKLELVANYRKAVQNNKLEVWKDSHVAIMMQYWLDAQDQFKPEILAALQGHRIEQQPSLAQILYQDENGQNDLYKVLTYKEDLMAGMAKNLIKVATEIEQECDERSSLTYSTQFTSKEQQLIKPAKIVNTVSQLAVFGGFGLILLGTALILSGVGIMPGLAVMGAGGMLATGGFAGIVVTDAKVIRFDSSSRNSNQKMRLLMQRDQNSNSDNVLSEDISSMPEDISDMSEDISDMSEERQRDHGNTKQTTWGQWIRSGFGLFKASQSEMSQGDSHYDTSDEQPKLLR